MGPGNLGTALALTLSSAGYKVKSIAIRSASKQPRAAGALARRLGAQLIRLGKQPLEGDIIWITVPDDSIADVACYLSEIGDWKGKTVFHSSGALTSDELEPLRSRGARVASMHPMMTFVRGQVPRMQGVAFGLEGDAPAVRMARSIIANLGAKAFVIAKENKVLYHVLGSFASPLLIALLATMDRVAVAAGIRKQDVRAVTTPLLRQTLNNYLKRGAANAFSGPLVRGDAATVRKHLAALERLPLPGEVYRTLARSASRYLPVKNHAAIEQGLKAKTIGP